MRVRWKLLFAFATIGVVYLSAAGPVAARKSSDWSRPVLVPNVNSAFGESGPAISRDGRSLYFTSNRPGGVGNQVGNQDIWVSKRVKDGWGTPENLGPTINTTAEEAVPAFSRDGHRMYFNSDRPGGFGLRDLWMSYRRNTRNDMGWKTPVNLGADVNSSSNDIGASYFASKEQGDDDDDDDEKGKDDDDRDGVALLFFGSSRPPGGPLAAELYVSAQNSDRSFGPPTLLSELNSSCNDLRPSIRADGLEIFFETRSAPSAICGGENFLRERCPFLPFRCNTGFTSDRADGEAHVHVRLFKFLEGVQGALHLDLTHNGRAADKEAMYLKTNQYHIAQCAYLTQRMKEISEGETSLLDNSILMATSSLFDGDATAPISCRS